MPSKFGVNVELYNKSLAPYKINNERPIAIVGDDSTLANGLHLFSSVEEALKKVGEGEVKNTLNDLLATGLHTQIILSTFTKEASENYGEASLNNKAISAINELKKAEAKLGTKPKFLLASGFNDAGVHEALKQLAEYLRAVYAIELDKTTESAINTALASYSTKTAIITFQKVIRIDKTIRPASAFLIASYAKVMASNEYGFSMTYSNKVIDGIIGVQDPVEFIQGVDCEADRLRGKGITCIIVDEGIRAWGGETCNDDLFSSVHTYVIFYTAIDTIFKAQKKAIDKRMRDVLKNVIDSLEAFYMRLIASNVAVGFRISIPKDINTNETISEGTIYINHEVQEMPLLKNITNRIYRVTDYSFKLIEEL